MRRQTTGFLAITCLATGLFPGINNENDVELVPTGPAGFLPGYTIFGLPMLAVEIGRSYETGRSLTLEFRADALEPRAKQPP